MKWLPLVLVLRNNFTLENHSLNSLSGTFLFHEQNTKERVGDERYSKLNQSSKSILSEQTRLSTLISMIDVSSSLKTILVKFHIGTEDVDKKPNDDLMAMVSKTLVFVL